MAIAIEFLETIPYFTGLNRKELEAIKRYVHERSVPRLETVESEGETSRQLHFVASGVVKVYKTSADGKEQILGLVRPGESFNDVPVFGGENLTSASAMSEVGLYDIGKDDLRTIVREYPQVALNVIRVLSRQVERLTALVEDLSFRPVVGRVARILLENSDGKQPRLTQQEMAAMAGTAREMVGRSLKALEEEGAIRLDRHRIVITSRKELEEIAR